MIRSRTFGSHPSELITEVVKLESGILAASKKLNEVMQDEYSRLMYWKCEMSKIDMNNRYDITREMKAMGESLSSIHIITGLPLEEIKILCNSALI